MSSDADGKGTTSIVGYGFTANCGRVCGTVDENHSLVLSDTCYPDHIRVIADVRNFSAFLDLYGWLAFTNEADRVMLEIVEQLQKRGFTAAWVVQIPVARDPRTDIPTQFLAVDGSAFFHDKTIKLSCNGRVWYMPTPATLNSCAKAVAPLGCSAAQKLKKVVENWGLFASPAPALPARL